MVGCDGRKSMLQIIAIIHNYCCSVKTKKKKLGENTLLHMTIYGHVHTH